VADGASIVWAARIGGNPLPERVTGIDLMQRLIERAADEGLSVFFLGAKPAVLERLVQFYRRRFPTLRIAGVADGYFGPDAHEALVRRIHASGADLLFIGMPSPFKEVWAEKNRARLGVRLILGVGGSFDVLAGVIPRAPILLQQCGLEWFWRLLCEPRRMWRRYLIGNTAFLAIALSFALRQRGRALTSRAN
jgi:N-acetylglucosaminyldiphosphoundecaprenol N-acetyl-beta-D-mannosaminyltransferase